MIPKLIIHTMKPTNILFDFFFCFLRLVLCILFLLEADMEFGELLSSTLLPFSKSTLLAAVCNFDDTIPFVLVVLPTLFRLGRVSLSPIFDEVRYYESIGYAFTTRIKLIRTVVRRIINMVWSLKSRTIASTS